MLLLSTGSVWAQFNLNGQFITRGEYRHGYNRSIGENQDDAQFIAHRARLQAQYRIDKLNMFVSVQDVRTWGSAPQANLTDDFLSLHEAWAEYHFSPEISAKIGRQELNYNGARFLGNLDWALQGRSHDFALLKWERDNRKLHLGGGYNQDAQKLTGHDYLMPNQYKSALFARYESAANSLQYALMFWHETRQRILTNPEGSYVAGTHNRQTMGIPTLKYTFGNTELSGYYYHQTGEDAAERHINAYNANAQIVQKIAIDTARGNMLRLAAGAEFISGTDQGSSDKNNSYSLQYGTNHAMNGYMDLFYVGGAHENSVGLNNYYVKGRYDFNPKFFVQADYHLFQANAEVLSANGSAMDASLGQELDLSAGFIVDPNFSIQAGYSQFFHTDTWQQLQPVALDKTQNWAYLMLIYRPGNPNKFIGIKL